MNLVTGTVFPTQGSATRSYVRDRVTGETKLVSVQSDGGAAPGNVTDVSDDGRFVLLETDSSSVVPYPPGCTVTIAGSSLPCSSISGVDAPIVVRDLHKGTSERVSVNTSGEPVVRGSHAATTSSEPRMTGRREQDRVLVGRGQPGIRRYQRKRRCVRSRTGHFGAARFRATHGLGHNPNPGCAVRTESVGGGALHSCSDAPGGSGLASCVGTLPDGALIDTSVGSHTFSVTATDYKSWATRPPRTSTTSLTSPRPRSSCRRRWMPAPYTPGQSALASYSCDDEVDGSGLASCSGTVASGSPIDTSTPGTGVFEVTATGDAGNATHLIRHYTVGSPGLVVAIYSPRIDAQYATGQVINADYACVPAPGGAAVASCVGSVPAGQPVDTGFGVRSFSVIATDVLGRATIETVQYRMFVLASVSGALPPEGGTVMTPHPDPGCAVLHGGDQPERRPRVDRRSGSGCRSADGLHRVGRAGAHHRTGRDAGRPAGPDVLRRGQCPAVGNRPVEHRALQGWRALSELPRGNDRSRRAHGMHLGPGSGAEWRRRHSHHRDLGLGIVLVLRGAAPGDRRGGSLGCRGQQRDPRPQRSGHAQPRAPPRSRPTGPRLPSP